MVMRSRNFTDLYSFVVLLESRIILQFVELIYHDFLCHKNSDLIPLDGIKQQQNFNLRIVNVSLSARD